MPRLEELQTLEGHTDRAWHVAWSPTGDALASCSGDTTVRIWARDAAGAPGGDARRAPWRLAAVLEGAHTRTVRSCSWAPDGAHLATASFDRTTAVWRRRGAPGGGGLDAAAWDAVAVLEGHESEVKGAAWAPSGSLLATCARDKTVWLWEAAPGDEFEVVDVKHGHAGDVKALAWHPGSEALASASYDDTLRVWADAGDEWECAQVLAGHASTVWDVAFEPPAGARAASASDDRSVRLWRCGGGGGRPPAWAPAGWVSRPGEHHGRTVFSVAWAPQGWVATACADNAIRVFSEEDGGGGGGGAGGGDGGSGGGGAAAAAAEGAAAAPGGGEEGGDEGGSAFRLACERAGAHPQDVNCVRWHPAEAGLLASAGDEGAVKLWLYSPV